jgi:hypothetical protein
VAIAVAVPNTATLIADAAPRNPQPSTPNLQRLVAAGDVAAVEVALTEAVKAVVVYSYDQRLAAAGDVAALNLEP